MLGLQSTTEMDGLLVSLQKRNLWSYWKWQTFEEKIGHFTWRQKIETYFPYNTFVSYIC